MFINDPQKTALAELIKPLFANPADARENRVAQLRALVLSYDGAILAGHVMLDLLEENGFGPLDIAVLATNNHSLPLALAVQHAAASRGLAYDVVLSDHEKLEGPAIAGRDVVGIGLTENETPQETEQLPLQACAALIGTGLAAYSSADVASGADHD